MPEVFPLTHYPRCFIPTASANFFEGILDDILEGIFYPHERETNPAKCCPSITNMNSFVQRLSPEDAMSLIDDFSKKRYKKHSVKYFPEVYHTNRIYQQYMSLKPTCFLILGPPNQDRYEAGILFAQRTKRIHLDVLDLVNLEISKRTKCGQWMYTNLLLGRCIPISIVLELVRQAVDQDVVKHRGYVLTGFPIIPAEDFNSDVLPKTLAEIELVQSIPTDLISNWLEKCNNANMLVAQQTNIEDVQDGEDSDENMEHDQESASVAQSYSNSSGASAKSISNLKLSEQAHKPARGVSEKNTEAKIRKLYQDFLTPRIENVAETKSQSYLDFLMNDPKLKNAVSEADVNGSVRHQLNFLLHLDLTPDAIFFIRSNKLEAPNLALGQTLESQNSTLNEKPLDFKNIFLFEVEERESRGSKVESTEVMRARQLSRYVACLPEISKFVLFYSKECVVKVDDRHSVEKTVEQFKNGIAFINYKFVHLPEHIVLTKSLKRSLATMSLDKQLDAICDYQCVQPNLKWLKSEMGTVCPVKLHLGKIQFGRARYAVRYLGQIFLLSSPWAISKFLFNPHKYFFAKVNCRVAVISFDSKRIAPVSNIFQELFNAKPFNWKDPLTLDPNVRSLDVFKTARQWALDLFFREISDLGKSQDSFQDEVLQGSRMLFKMNAEKLLDILSSNGQSLDDVGKAIEFVEELGIDADPDTVRTVLKRVISKMDGLAEEEVNQQLLLPPPDVVPHADIIAKLTEFMFYELYKENEFQQLASQTTNWIKMLDKTFRMQELNSFSQWILEDMPTKIDFWKQLKNDACLPDVVIILLDDWVANYKKTNFDEDESFDLKPDDSDELASKIAVSFPQVFGDIGKDGLMGMVSTALKIPSGTVDNLLWIEKSAREKKNADNNANGDLSEGTIKETIQFFQQENIPVITSSESGQTGILEILENYLKLFRPQSKILSEDEVKKILDVNNLIHEQSPKLPSECTTDFESIYKLELKYLEKDAEFEYKQHVQTYPHIQIKNEDEIEVQEDEDATLDIDVLSQDNIQRVKECESLFYFNLGNTGKYCPVALTKNRLLQLGAPKYTVEYGSKIYRMSTEDHLNEFARCPFRYVFENDEPSVPPFRICVIGPSVRFRNKFIRRLARKLNMKPIFYSHLMTEYLDTTNPNNTAILKTDDELYEQYGEDFLRTILKPLFEHGIILEGFPNNEKQFMDMMKNNLYPERIFIVDGEPHEALHYAFVQSHLRWEKQLQLRCKQFLEQVEQFARNSTEITGIKLPDHIAKQAADIETELGHLQKAIIQTQEKMLEESDVSSSFAAQNQEKDKSSPDHFHDLKLTPEHAIEIRVDPSLSTEEDAGQEEGEAIRFPSNPVPTPVERNKMKHILMTATKTSLLDSLMQLKKVIRLCIDNHIPVISTAGCCSKRYDLRHAMLNVENRQCIFNHVIVASPEVAKQCLQSGFSLYSHFKTFCPIDASRYFPINVHYSMKQSGNLYGCLFRNLLYYANTTVNLSKFLFTPRTFASGTNPFELVTPMRILVIGPAYSGVTTLCKRITREFGMTYLTRQHFRRHLEEKRPNKNTVGKYSFDSVLDDLKNLSLELLVDCLHFHRNDSSNGIVLDNYPITSDDLVEAARANVNFHNILVIKTEFWCVWRNWKTGYVQNESQVYVSVLDQLIRMYRHFKNENITLRQYETSTTDLQLFNIVHLKRASSKWVLWEDAKSEILLSLRENGNYNKNIRMGQCVGISRMNIFREEFEKRLSVIKRYCPVCLKTHGRLVKHRHDFYIVGSEFFGPSCQRQLNQPYGHNQETIYTKYDFPKPDAVSDYTDPILTRNMFKANLVQYRENFYWTCDEHHFDIVLSGPFYLPPELLIYPAFIPFLVINYFHNFVAHDGFCVVNYRDNLPKKIYVRGDPNFAIYYRGKIFLCESSNCALRFLEYPELYYQVPMPPPSTPYVDLDVKEMEFNFGPLTPEAIVEALKALADFRPKHFALDIRQSAVIFVGLYLKTVNPLNRPGAAELNERMYSKYLDECSYFLWLTKKLKEQINPYIR